MHEELVRLVILLTKTQLLITQHERAYPHDHPFNLYQESQDLEEQIIEIAAALDAKEE